MNVPYWVSTSMEGALIASSGYGFIDPPRTIGNNIVSVLAGSAGVMAGKVIFKWIQRYQNSPTPSLSLQTVARLTDTSRGGGGKEVAISWTKCSHWTCNTYVDKTRCITPPSGMTGNTCQVSCPGGPVCPKCPKSKYDDGDVFTM